MTALGLLLGQLISFYPAILAQTIRIRFQTFTALTAGRLRKTSLFQAVASVEITRKKVAATTESIHGLSHGSEASVRAIVLKLTYSNFGHPMVMLMDSEEICPLDMLSRAR